MSATREAPARVVRIDAAAGIDLAIASFTGLRAHADAAAAALGPQERARAARYADLEDAERFVLGRWLLRLTLAYRDLRDAAGGAAIEPCDPAVVARAGGVGFAERPGLPPTRSGVGEALRFSLSRSSTCAVAAIGATRALGADVEDLEGAASLDEVFGDAYFDPRETEFIGRTQKSGPMRLLRGWTAKEAIAKAAGQGLRLALREIVVLDDVVRALPAGLPNPADCRLRRLETDDATVCVAWW